MKKKKALLINDSKFESMVLSDMLSKLNYDVEIADEFDALYEIDQFSPDIVVVNYIMQETSGDNLINLIKDERPQTKCLLSSSNIITLSDFDDKKVDGILRTPVSMFTLRDTLSRVGEYENVEEFNHPYVETYKIENTIICSSCNRDISSLGTNIMFCPFCGEELD